MSSSEPLQQASALAQAIEALADQLTPEVIRAARGMPMDGAISIASNMPSAPLARR